MTQPSSTNLFDLQVDQQSAAYLSETARWARFLSIIGFIFCGLLLLFGIFFSSLLGNLMNQYGTNSAGLMMLGGGFFTIIYVLIALLYFFPCLYLFNFSSKMKTALRTSNQDLLVSSLKNLKSCFKFIGILTVIVLSLYLLAIVFGVMGSIVGRH